MLRVAQFLCLYVVLLALGAICAPASSRAAGEVTGDSVRRVSAGSIEVAPLRPVARLAVVAVPVVALTATIRPTPRPIAKVPRARWDHRAGGQLWTVSAMMALRGHGRVLTDMVPRDIDTWCPGYREGDATQRAAFWAGYMSALAKHESTYRADAVGGGGLWYGLLQILPATARGYKCRARSGEALKHGPSNLSCAVRIMAVTVPRDGVIHGKDRKWRGVSADWGPMRSPSKRNDIARWTRAQTYCTAIGTIRPQARP